MGDAGQIPTSELEWPFPAPNPAGVKLRCPNPLSPNAIAVLPCVQCIPWSPSSSSLSSCSDHQHHPPALAPDTESPTPPESSPVTQNRQPITDLSFRVFRGCYPLTSLRVLRALRGGKSRTLRSDIRTPNDSVPNHSVFHDPSQTTDNRHPFRKSLPSLQPSYSLSCPQSCSPALRSSSPQTTDTIRRPYAHSDHLRHTEALR